MPEQESATVTDCRCGTPVACPCPCGACEVRRVTLAARAAEDYRRCTRCDRSLPESDFPVRTGGTRQSWCRECGADHARERRAARRRTPSARPLPARRFGVEIECHTGQRSLSDVAAHLRRETGIECYEASAGHVPTGHWRVVYDGSVSDGAEVVSPILSGETGRTVLTRVLRALQGIGTVSSECGLHIHLEVTDLPAAGLARLVRSWHDEQDVIDGLVASTRRGQTSYGYCRRLDSCDLRAVDAMAADHGESRITRRDALAYLGAYGPEDHYRDDRYRTLNFRPYVATGTVEIRQHQGTLNPSKVLAWLAFGMALVERAKAGPSAERGTVGALVDTLEAHGLDPFVGSYLIDRARRFARSEDVA